MQYEPIGNGRKEDWCKMLKIIYYYWIQSTFATFLKLGNISKSKTEKSSGWSCEESEVAMIWSNKSWPLWSVCTCVILHYIEYQSPCPSPYIRRLYMFDRQSSNPGLQRLILNFRLALFYFIYKQLRCMYSKDMFLKTFEWRRKQKFIKHCEPIPDLHHYRYLPVWLPNSLCHPGK